MKKRICILSDSHDNVSALTRALQLCRGCTPEFLVHCGDITSPEMLDYFQGLPARFVFGNNDQQRVELQKRADKWGFAALEDELDFEAAGFALHVYHGTSRKTLERGIASQDYDFILTGHTHRARDEQCGRTRVINPGALYAAPVYSIAVLDLERRGRSQGMAKLKFLEVPKK